MKDIIFYIFLTILVVVGLVVGIQSYLEFRHIDKDNK